MLESIHAFLVRKLNETIVFSKDVLKAIVKSFPSILALNVFMTLFFAVIGYLLDQVIYASKELPLDAVGVMALLLVIFFVVFPLSTAVQLNDVIEEEKKYLIGFLILLVIYLPLSAIIGFFFFPDFLVEVIIYAGVGIPFVAVFLWALFDGFENVSKSVKKMEQRFYRKATKDYKEEISTSAIETNEGSTSPSSTRTATVGRLSPFKAGVAVGFSYGALYVISYIVLVIARYISLTQNDLRDAEIDTVKIFIGFFIHPFLILLFVFILALAFPRVFDKLKSSAWLIDQTFQKMLEFAGAIIGLLIILFFGFLGVKNVFGDTTLYLQVTLYIILPLMFILLLIGSAAEIHEEKKKYDQEAATPASYGLTIAIVLLIFALAFIHAWSTVTETSWSIYRY